MNLEDIKSFTFPGGEIQVVLDDTVPNDGFIYASIRNSDDIIKLLLATDAYTRKYGHKPELYLPYIPYARQDRVANKGESLSIKVFTDLINSQEYPVVHVLDPHSDISTALINNIKVTDSTEFAKKVCKQIDINDYTLIAPDAGCLKKVYKIAKEVGYTGEVVFCEKQRDTVTGNITGTKIYCSILEDKNFILFDDICDGGRTFIEIAKILKANGCNKVILATTHGIYSKGLEVMFEYIDELYCTDSFKEIDCPSGMKQFNALNLMQGYDMAQLQKDIRKAV